MVFDITILKLATKSCIFVLHLVISTNLLISFPLYVLSDEFEAR